MADYEDKISGKHQPRVNDADHVGWEGAEDFDDQALLSVRQDYDPSAQSRPDSARGIAQAGAYRQSLSPSTADVWRAEDEEEQFEDKYLSSRNEGNEQDNRLRDVHVKNTTPAIRHFFVFLELFWVHFRVCFTCNYF